MGIEGVFRYIEKNVLVLDNRKLYKEIDLINAQQVCQNQGHMALECIILVVCPPHYRGTGLINYTRIVDPLNIVRDVRPSCE